jgi:hypothetical protein
MEGARIVLGYSAFEGSSGASNVVAAIRTPENVKPSTIDHSCIHPSRRGQDAAPQDEVRLGGVNSKDDLATRQHELASCVSAQKNVANLKMFARTSRSASPAETRKRPRGIQPKGRSKESARSFLEDSEHDRTDEGKCDIRGNNAQSARERSHEGHRNFSVIHIAAN